MSLYAAYTSYVKLRLLYQATVTASDDTASDVDP
jgi:hypothetical protein